MKRFLVILMLTAFVLSGCGASRAPAVAQYQNVEGDVNFRSGMPAMGGGYAEGAPVVVEEYKYDEAANPSVNTQDRLVIQNADLSIVVADPKAKMEAIAAMAARMGGFVVNSTMYQTTTSGGQKVPEGSITVRVPAEKLDEALDEIKQGVGEVLNESRSGQM